MTKCGRELIFQETCVFVSQICEPREVKKTQRECCCSTGRHEERGWGSSRSRSRVMWGGGYTRCGSNNLWEDGAGRKWPWRVPIQTKVSRFYKVIVLLYVFTCFTFYHSCFLSFFLMLRYFQYYWWHLTLRSLWMFCKYCGSLELYFDKKQFNIWPRSLFWIKKSCFKFE